MVAAFPQPVWWPAPAPEAATQPAAVEAQATQPSQSVGASAEAAPAASGDAAAPTADDDQERWEALFNFLKRDGEQPPPVPSEAALMSLGAAGVGGIAAQTPGVAAAK
mmetsp:Transcript_6271/g.17870  ORF Transcript_6271/g.17870 Transcript_6271/m.17870 type:complete len:108 (-) Transcript_6271:154-477(-)